MKLPILLSTILRWFLKISSADMANIWENVVTGVTKMQDRNMSGAQKAEFVVELVRNMVPTNLTGVAGQVVRMLIEIALIILRSREKK